MVGFLGIGLRVIVFFSVLFSNYGSGNFDEIVGKKGKIGLCVNLVFFFFLILERVFFLLGESSAFW